jgi:hypothetical protein
VHDAETGRLKNVDEEDDSDMSSIESSNKFVKELSKRFNISNGGEK